MKKPLLWTTREMISFTCAAFISGVLCGAIIVGVVEYLREPSIESSVIFTPSVEAEAPQIIDEPVVKPSTDEIDISKPEYRDEIIYIAKTVYGEARGCTTTEQAAVVWSILNRVDSDLKYMPDDIIGVVTQKDQYLGYNPKHPVTDEIANLVEDVIGRWAMEKAGEKNVGRVLPKDYLWFYGDGKHNHFTDAWRNGNKWDWSLESPYEED